MFKSSQKFFFYLSSFVACAILALSTGCASGGYKITRQLSKWVNSQNIIIRIILYIFAGLAWAITLLIDMVVFNTIDFWEGKISAGDYQFKDGEKTFYVKHEILPGSNLKKSTIQIKDLNEKLLQTVVLSQTVQGDIETYVDGQLRTAVTNINSLPIITNYNASGKMIEQKLFLETGINTLIANGTH